MERDALQIHLRNLVDVLLVLLAHHDIGDAGTLGSQNLLLDATNGQYLAAQRNLARHGRVLAHLALGQCRGDRGSDGDACRRTVLRRSTLRHVDVDVPMVEDAVVDAQQVNVGLDIFQCDDGTLLHHVAQITGQRQLASLTFRQRGLDEQYLATHAGPCQSGHHASIGVALVDVAIEGWLAQQVFQLRGSNLVEGQLAVRSIFHSHLAQSLVDLLLQLAHATLAGVLLDNLLDGGLVEGQLLVLQTGVVLLLGHQVALGNLVFLFSDIAADLDNLHSVE